MPCNTSSQLETESLKNRVKESRLLLSINWYCLFFTNSLLYLFNSSSVHVSSFLFLKGLLKRRFTNFQSRKRLYNHKCLFVRPSVCKTPQQFEIIIPHHSTFILHHSSFILHHPSSFFIHPSFISRLLSFSACWDLGAKGSFQKTSWKA